MTHAPILRARRLSPLLALALLPAAAGPGDARERGGPAGCDSIAAVPIAWNIDYEADIQPIWDQRCANCHVDHAGLYLGDLDLDPGVSWDNLVGQDAFGDPSMLRVRPGQPLASALFLKLNCEEPGFGVRMPSGRPPIPLTEQALVFDWIAAGAPYGKTDIVFFDGFEGRP